MTPAPKPPAPARRAASLILVTVALIVPALSLIPLGSLWLWQNGYLLHWTAFALAAVGAVYVLQRRLLPTPSAAAPRAAAPSQTAATPPTSGSAAHDLGWSPAEEQAWTDVQALAHRTEIAHISSPDALLKLGQETIEVVARRLHHERSDPLWQFTTPEALAIVERVSRRLRTFVLDQVPFGDRLTVAQALALYRWRGTIEVAERAYDIWRVLRLANPITAATNEAREQLSRAMMQWGRDAIARRLGEAYVHEIGRAAIDLYGGRLRVSADDLAAFVSDETAADRTAVRQARAEPLRILVAGQTGVGKSSLVNALAAEARAASDALPATSGFTAYRLEREGLPAAMIVDSPGIGIDPKPQRELLERATDSDLVLWVVAANRADRNIDRRALDGLRLHFASRMNRRRPPLILVATHIDRLRPFNEWKPPYDLENDTGEKARTIRAAVAAAAHDLGFTSDETVPVSLIDPARPFNVEHLWTRIAEALPEAMRAQLLRCLNTLKDGWSWRTAWTQAANASRTIAGSLRRASPGKKENP